VNLGGEVIDWVGIQMDRPADMHVFSRGMQVIQFQRQVFSKGGLRVG